MEKELFECDSTDLPDHVVQWLLDYLRGKGWRTATQILFDISQPDNESTKRRLRKIANGSGGQIAGGQKGYRLVDDMTHEEYMHWRNWVTSQADEMRLRVVKGDRFFFGRKSVKPPIKGPMPEFSR